jgi:hypothetical protein
MATERHDRSRLQIALLDGATPLPAFTCGDEDLDGFLRDDALRLQKADVTRVYLAWYETELVGYAAVLTDAIQLRTNDVKRLKPLTYVDSKIIPAVKLGRLGVSVSFRRQFSGCGTELVRTAANVALTIGGLAGCRLLTLDAYQDSVAFYRKLGFATRPSDADDHTRRTVPMWLDLLADHSWIWAT